MSATITRYLHNLTENTLYYFGVALPANDVFQIPTNKHNMYANSDTVVADVAAGLIGISADGVDDYTGNAGINLLKDEKPTDTDGAMLQRLKMAPSGWTFQARGLTLETSVLTSVVNTDWSGTALTDATLKLYDASGTLITDQTTANTDCVKTVLDWEPTYDYEIVGGFLACDADPATDIYCYIIAVPDVSYASGGSRCLVSNVNLNYISQDDRLSIDGRTPKYLAYSATYHTNKIRLQLNHAAGVKWKLSLVFEHYRA